MKSPGAQRGIGEGAYTKIDADMDILRTDCLDTLALSVEAVFGVLEAALLP